MAFASVYYYQSSMLNELYGEYIFKVSPFFRDISQNFIDCAIAAYPWDNIKFTLKGTCAPPHVILMSKMEELMRNFRECALISRMASLQRWIVEVLGGLKPTLTKQLNILK